MKKVLFTATVDSHILQFHIPFLKLFKDNGYEVHVATNGNEKIPYCDKKHIICFERSPYKINNLKAIKELKKIIDCEQFDIIHCHTPMGSVVTRLAAKKARKKGTRVIYTAHGFHFYKGAPILNWLLFYPVEKYLAKYTDTLITINQEDYELAKKKFSKRCNDIEYVPGVGIDPNKFNIKMSDKEKHDLRKSIGLKDDDFVMIYPAELSKRKRQIWLINTISPLLKENHRIHLLLPGKDSLNGKCQKLVNKLKLEKQIHFLGYRKDIPKLLKISNLAVSSAKQEGLPVNLMEAMYVGLPIVATNCRGNRDLIENGKNGFLVEAHDTKRIVKNIENIVLNNNINLYNKESSTTKKNYLIQAISKSMCEIYNFEKNKTNDDKKIAIVTSGFLPVPASKGGAVETLIDTIISQNEIKCRIKPTIFSVYDEEAIKMSRKYNKSNFIFIKPSFISKMLDSIIYFVIDKIIKKSNSRKYRYIFQRFNFLYKCSVFLKNNNYDKVLLENHTIMYLVLKWKKNYLKYRNNYYYHCHNIVPSKYGMEDIIKQTNRIISVSNFRNEYVKEFFNVNDNQCSVVLNCCSADIYNKPSKQELDILIEKYNLKNVPTLLYIGRIDQDKGTLELINACNMINNKNFKLLIVGAPIFDTGIKTEYEKIVKNKILKNSNVIMVGYVKHEELYKYYSLADVVAIPSQIDDSAPLVLIEALASGKPIIATNCGGIPEYTNDKCAILVDKGEEYIKNLALAIEKILFDKKAIKIMSNESLKQSKKYSEEKYYDDFINELLK